MTRKLTKAELARLRPWRAELHGSRWYVVRGKTVRKIGDARKPGVAEAAQREADRRNRLPS